MSITTQGKKTFFELGALDACCDLLTDTCKLKYYRSSYKLFQILCTDETNGVLITYAYLSVSESRLNAVTAISIIGEVPAGRQYILQNKVNCGHTYNRVHAL